MCRRDLNTHTYTHAHTETHTRTQADVRVKREGPADNKMEAMREGLPEKKRNRKHLPSSARRRLLLADFTEANGRGRVREKKRVDEVPNVHERVHSSNKVKKNRANKISGRKEHENNGRRRVARKGPRAQVRENPREKTCWEEHGSKIPLQILDENMKNNIKTNTRLFKYTEIDFSCALWPESETM